VPIWSLPESELVFEFAFSELNLLVEHIPMSAMIKEQTNQEKVSINKLKYFERKMGPLNACMEWELQQD
jgi:hypothetical protein